MTCLLKDSGHRNLAAPRTRTWTSQKNWSRVNRMPRPEVSWVVGSWYSLTGQMQRFSQVSLRFGQYKRKASFTNWGCRYSPRYPTLCFRCGMCFNLSFLLFFCLLCPSHVCRVSLPPTLHFIVSPIKFTSVICSFCSLLCFKWEES